MKEHFDHMKVEKEKESLRFELNKARAQIKEAETAIASQKAEIEKLNHIINEADQERLRQKKEYDIVINERDILGTQLIRRNDELALLYEKIKIQQSTLNKGQIQYRDRLNEIRVLKIKLNDLKRELAILKNSVSNIDVLKREVSEEPSEGDEGRAVREQNETTGFSLYLVRNRCFEIHTWCSIRHSVGVGVTPPVPAATHNPQAHLIASCCVAGAPPRARAAAGAYQGEGAVRGAGEPSQRASVAQAGGV